MGLALTQQTLNSKKHIIVQEKAVVTKFLSYQPVLNIFREKRI